MGPIIALSWAYGWYALSSGSAITGYGTVVVFSELGVGGIGTVHFGSEGRNKEHQDPRLSINMYMYTLTGPCTPVYAQQ